MCSEAETEEEVDASLQKALLQLQSSSSSSSLAPTPFSHAIDDENGDGVCCRLGTVPTIKKKKKKRKRTRSGGRTIPAGARGGRGGTGSCPEASAAADTLPDNRQ
jgi:hypothetical protein